MIFKPIMLIILLFNIQICLSGASQSHEQSDDEYDDEIELFSMAHEIYNMGDCSDSDFEYAELKCAQIYNYSDNEEIKIQISFFLMQMYFHGTLNGKNKNFKNVFILLQLTTTQNINEEIRIKSNYYLGLYFYRVTHQYRYSQIYFAIAYGQNNYPQEQIRAAYYLGKIHYFGKCHEPDLEQSKLFFEEVINAENSSNQIKSEAQLYLNKINEIQKIP